LVILFLSRDISETEVETLHVGIVPYTGRLMPIIKVDNRYSAFRYSKKVPQSAASAVMRTVEM